MKANMPRAAILMASSVAALAVTPLSLADTFSGTLGAGNVNIEPTDVYALACPIGTATVRARASTSGADQLSVQVINPNGLANTVISLAGISPQPTAVVAGRAGNYLVTLHKSPTISAVSYTLALDCYNARGVAFVNTQSVLVQNQ